MKNIDTYFEKLSSGQRIRYTFIAMTVLFTLILMVFAIGYGANKRRIHDIENNRIKSCESTYLAFVEVFKPFLPKNPTTKKQQKTLNLFYGNIHRLVRQCDKQINGKSQIGNPNNSKTPPVRSENDG